MSRWFALSTKSRMQSIFFVAFGCLLIAVSLMGQQQLSAILNQIPIGLTIIAIAANPTNCENGIVLNWLTQPIYSKALFALAAASLVVSVPLRWFA